MAHYFFAFVLITWSFQVLSQEVIQIVYPREGQLLSTIDSSFIFGRVLISPAKLKINGMETPLSKGGAFIQFVPLDEVQPDSSFLFRCQIQTENDIKTIERKVFLPIPPKSILGMDFDPRFCEPGKDVDLPVGEIVQLQCRTISGAQVTFSLEGAQEEYPMAEWKDSTMDNFGIAAFGTEKSTSQKPVSGVYRASYVLDSKHKPKRIHYRVYSDKGSAECFTYGKVSCGQIFSSGETIDSLNVARVSPGLAYHYFWPRGVRVIINGKSDGYYRIQLGEKRAAWLPEQQVQLLPSSIPSAIVRVVRIKKEGRSSTIKLTMDEKLPFQVEQVGQKALRLKIFGANSDVDWMRFENGNNEITDIQWTQGEDRVFELTVQLKDSQLWGHDVRYEGKNLIWKIRHRPGSAFKNFKICIDPGHTKDIGSTGPRGNQERQVNVEVAQRLKKVLEREGMQVVLTHTDTTQGLSLLDRSRIANLAECDIFVSVHQNAVPDGVNPFNQSYGPSVIYYHPQSQFLAEKILKSMVSKTGWPSFGLLQGNIAVCRNVYMPSVLVECGFIMLPNQEEKLTDVAFQSVIAESIRDGIKNFIKK